MSVGIKIYNQKNQVLINSDYQNLALIDVIDAANITQKEMVYANSVVIVEEMMPVNGAVAYAGLAYQNNTYKLIIRNLHRAKQKFYVFGGPDKKADGQAGLVIYQSNTQKVAFDSRIPYLQIVGEVYDGAKIDAHKKYGILHRAIPKFGLEYDMSNKTIAHTWTEVFGVSSDVIKAFTVNTGVGTGRNNPRFTSSIEQYPLLVDLSNIPVS